MTSLFSRKKQVHTVSFRFSLLTFFLLILATASESAQRKFRQLSTVPKDSIDLFSTYIGTASYEYGYALTQDNQGNYIATGTGNNYETGYFLDRVPRNVTFGESSLIVVKLNRVGTLVSSKVIGTGILDDNGQAIIVNAHGDYVLAGGTHIFDIVPYNDDFDPFPFDDRIYAPDYNAYTDGLIIKLNPDLEILWAISLGVNVSVDEFKSIIQCGDGNYVAAGSQNNKALIVKINDIGELLWAVTQTILDEVIIYSIVETSNGGYLIAGYTDSYLSSIGRKILLTSLSNAGVALWSRTIGGLTSATEVAHSLIIGHNGTYVFAGYTSSSGDGYYDLVVVEISESGEIINAFTLGGKIGRFDGANCIIKTRDGGYALVGSTGSHGAGSRDIMVVKFAEGLSKLKWIKTIGGLYSDSGDSIIESDDGGLVLTGYLYHIDNIYNRVYDLCVLKLDVNGNMVPIPGFYLQDHTANFTLKSIALTVTELSIATEPVTLERHVVTDVLGIIDGNFNVTFSSLPATPVAPSSIAINSAPKRQQTWSNYANTKSNAENTKTKKTSATFSIDNCIREKEKSCHQRVSVECEKGAAIGCKKNGSLTLKNCLTLFKSNCIKKKNGLCRSDAKIQCLKLSK